jgi:hypothetical protein
MMKSFQTRGHEVSFPLPYTRWDETAGLAEEPKLSVAHSEMLKETSHQKD